LIAKQDYVTPHSIGYISVLQYLNTETFRAIKSRRTRLTEYVRCIGEMRNAYKILGGKPEGKNY
jgi:hypothetical protein